MKRNEDPLEENFSLPFKRKWEKLNRQPEPEMNSFSHFNDIKKRTAEKEEI